MRITGKQAYVLEHLERVQPRPYTVVVTSPLRRYQLDGWDCTAQITGLVVKHLVKENASVLLRGPRLPVLSSPEAVPHS